MRSGQAPYAGEKEALGILYVYDHYSSWAMRLSNRNQGRGPDMAGGCMALLVHPDRARVFFVRRADDEGKKQILDIARALCHFSGGVFFYFTVFLVAFGTTVSGPCLGHCPSFNLRMSCKRFKDITRVRFICSVARIGEEPFRRPFMSFVS
ncbi:hypothetical protein F4802DRAFT_500393 [Xylaria palmicola]|nr:hypothetical protein F4802DRAFT_500393 [Xylaria palmicola]